MSTKPRTPRYFPRMKLRGAHRHRRAVWDRLLRGFDGLRDASVSAAKAIQAFAQAVNKEVTK